MRFAASGGDNCVEVGGRRYVHVSGRQGTFVLAATCPHRGGPLHLGEPDPSGRRLVCPWHGGGTPLAALRRRVPAVRRGDTVTAVLPDDADTPVRVCHVPLSAALGA